MSLHGTTGDDDSITTYPESPSEVGQWAPYKNNPAAFALTLAEHSGFDAVARTMTPPPSYSRHAPIPPKLTLLIPGVMPSDGRDATAASGAVPVSPDECAIESTGTSPAEASSSRQSEDSLLRKVKVGLKKRGTGLKTRFRRPSGGSRSSSASTSPNDVVPSSPGYQDRGSFGSSSYPTTPLRSLPPIQELDGQPINSSNVRIRTTEAGQAPDVWQPAFDWEYSSTSLPPGLDRSTSSSSIVPTPKRGLSFASPASGFARSSNVNATELSGRLESLDNHAVRQNPDVVVSPCSPSSSTSMSGLQRASLLRSNAVTDSIMRLTPVSPLSAFSRSPIGPPTTPTLDGRLSGLSRLALPGQSDAPTNHKYPSRPLHSYNQRQELAESDSGKELVVQSSPVFERLERPFNAPHWGSQALRRNASMLSIQDLGSDAPEVVMQESSTPPATSPQAIRDYRPPYMTRPYAQPNSLAALVGAVCEATASAVVASTSFLKSRYGPEPSIPENHVRVRWRCTCGEHLYDDYVENRSGAAAALEAYLNRAPQFWTHGPGSHPSSATSAGSPIFSVGGPSPLSSVSSWPSPGLNSPNGFERDYSKQTGRVGASSAFGFNLKSYMEPLWLYTCVNEGRWTTKMRHLDVNSSKISSDKDLALALGSLYSSVNRKWYKFLKLRSLTTIKFVQFELHRNRFADISRSPALPNPQSPEGFTYEFMPHDLTPPVGSNYLMHLFRHPEDYDDEFITYQRTPKRRNRLETGTGWGLELVEGFMAERVWGALAVLFLIGSLVFAVTWATRKGDDLQGAFGVAGYMVGSAGLVLAWAQAVLD